jgi:hypothetical protein
MVRNPTPEPARLAAGWHALGVAAGVLALVEILRRWQSSGEADFGALGAGRALLIVVVALVAAVALHHGLVWTLVGVAGRRFGKRAAFWASLGCALVYGWLWQGTVTGGDGLAASAWGGTIRVALALGIPLGLAGFAGVVAWPGTLPAPVRLVVLAAALVAGIVVTLFVLPGYRAFHGFLGGFEAGVVALLVGARWPVRPVSFVVLAAALGGFVLFLLRPALSLGYLRRQTRLPGTMLEALPVTRALLPEVKLFVDPSAPPSVAPPAPPVPAPSVARGDSVLLVVLEATRSDTWSDPTVAPEFARWQRHGVYVPRAVSQYPATPLAYGAIFTSHPPSIVAQSSHWSRRRLFEELAPRFRTVFLSQPDERWFDTGAMTSFIVGDPTVVRRHKSTGAALSGLKEVLAGDAGKGSFFAWVHLFDPHRPYRARGKTSPTASVPERYRSEVHAMDADLGAFMHWFYAEPLARRTLVIVVADHGQALGELLDGEPYIGHHVHVADSIAHIPLFASGPGLPVNVRESALGVSQLDVMPTIYDHVGVPLPAALVAQGVPLPRLLAERPVRSLPTEAFSIRGREFFTFLARAGRADVAKQRRMFREMWETGTYPPKLALERDGWKLVRDVVLETDALYDLRADPRETKDVAGKRPLELRAMQAAVEAWSRSQVNVLHQLDRVE